MRFFWLLILLSVGTPLHAECIEWQKAFAKSQITQIPTTKGIVLISPFKNATEQKGDDWLGDGIPELLRRYLNNNQRWEILPTALGEALPAGRKPEFFLEGQFQHHNNSLRYFVQIKDANREVVGVIPMETPYPLHKNFFVGSRETAEAILHKMGLERANTGAMKEIQNETSNVRAYENFIKGKQALASYDRPQMDVALVWFQEARREDPYFPAPYLGMMETYGFLSLYTKQEGKPYQNFLENMENILNEMERLKKLRTSSPMKREKLELKDRYLKSHVHYSSAMHLIEKDNWHGAAEELEQALALVAEDAIATLALAKVYDKLGMTKEARRYRARAKEINPCYEN